MEVDQLPKDKKIVLFDGVCNMCDSLVQYVIRRDTKDVFRFVQLQSETGMKILQHIGVDREKMDSIILYEPGIAYYYKSAAVLEIVKALGGIAGLLSVFKIVPTSIRNSVYDYVARNRYKWYGKKDSCMMPTKEMLSKFL